MKDEQFEALVRKLEVRASENPAAYRGRVVLLAVLGNLYMIVMLLAVVALLVALAASVAVFKAIAVKLLLVVGVFLWMILKALWVRIEPPVGRELSRREAPELFATIDALRSALHAPPFHRVLINDDFNASVVQSPRLGIFGWYRNYLLIGLPLMQSLSVDQFKAVLAHEFGHLAQGHGRMSSWIYCQRMRWNRLLSTLEANNSRASFLFKPFLNWFVPYFSAWSFPLARSNEYEADAISARLTSPQAAAEALTRVNVVGAYLDERYWPRIYQMADDQPQPGFAPYAHLGHHVIAEIDDDSAARWLTKSMTRNTGVGDTHPALADRLKAIGESPRFVALEHGQGAQRLLGDALVQLSEYFDASWKGAVLASWENRYREVQDGRARLAELNASIRRGEELSVQAYCDRARLTERVGGDPDGALLQFRALHERFPDEPLICFGLGTLLLERDDAHGCELVEHVMRLDEDAIVGGCEALRDFHLRNGRDAEARVWHERMADRWQQEQAAQQERGEVLLTDTFERHALSTDTLSALRAQLAAVVGLRKAYLVRKRVRHFPDRPCYVLGYNTTPFYRLRSKRRTEQVMRDIQSSVDFPGDTIIICVEGENYRFGRKLRFMRGTRVL
ncbi:MAG: M48 family metalloprotease [Rhodocyclales bacterium]|nr:M48 family metalloprotease [Rhodocyclales bacterium]